MDEKYRVITISNNKWFYKGIADLLVVPAFNVEPEELGVTPCFLMSDDIVMVNVSDLNLMKMQSVFGWLRLARSRNIYLFGIRKDLGAIPRFVLAITNWNWLTTCSFPVGQVSITIHKLSQHRLSKHSERLVNPLTTSEIAVLNYLSSGMSMGEVAKIKNISVKTVSYHKCQVIKKLGMHSSFVFLNRAHSEQLCHS